MNCGWDKLVGCRTMMRSLLCGVEFSPVHIPLILIIILIKQSPSEMCPLVYQCLTYVVKKKAISNRLISM